MFPVLQEEQISLLPVNLLRAANNQQRALGDENMPLGYRSGAEGRQLSQLRFQKVRLQQP